MQNIKWLCYTFKFDIFIKYREVINTLCKNIDAEEKK